MSFKYTPQTLKRIESLFEELAYTIRYEKGNFQSGYCILDERRIAVINKFLNAEGRINVLVEILPQVSVDLDKLSTEGKALYEELMKTPIDK
ncbi:MAG: hypothetical protein RL660_1644 [Bacteroidota bacterium]|jgi:hypothetical protein